MTEQTITRSGRPRWQPGRACLAVVALTCSGAALVAGCTSSGAASANKAPKPAAASSPAASVSGMPKAATCVHINSIRTSLTSLTHVSVSSASASKLATDLADIQSHLNALKGQHLGAFSPQEKQLRAELDKIKKDAAGLSTDPNKAAKMLNADLDSLKHKAGPMIVEMRMICHAT